MPIEVDHKENAPFRAHETAPWGRSIKLSREQIYSSIYGKGGGQGKQKLHDSRNFTIPKRSRCLKRPAESNPGPVSEHARLAPSACARYNHGHQARIRFLHHHEALTSHAALNELLNKNVRHPGGRDRSPSEKCLANRSVTAISTRYDRVACLLLYVGQH